MTNIELIKKYPYRTAKIFSNVKVPEKEFPWVKDYLDNHECGIFLINNELKISIQLSDWIVYFGEIKEGAW